MIDLPDVNLWLALTSDSHAHHARALAWFDAVPARNSAFCRVTQHSLLRLLTNPKVMGADVLDNKQAWSIYDTTCSDERVLFLTEPSDVDVVWRRLTSVSEPRTLQWTDAYLAAFALTTGLRVVTFDRGFREYPDVNVLLL
ncbi:MAG TPA: TA system VapC family ribonuclease toxin [Planctomycetota bacterium]